jgi:hypothetical protein
MSEKSWDEHGAMIASIRNETYMVRHWNQGNGCAVTHTFAMRHSTILNS